MTSQIAQPPSLFTLSELRRVGIATTMLVVVGTAIILTLLFALGHYSSLSHALPKAILDGAVIALLLNTRGRWRSLALLGTVYGLVLLLQIGVVYLLPVFIVAGIIAAMTGRVLDTFHRPAALYCAAILYELLAGFGAPIKIYFATDGQREPFLWALWFAEWPLRIIGSSIGVFLALRWLKKPASAPQPAPDALASTTTPLRPSKPSLPKPKGAHHAALRLVASVIACILPMGLHSARALAIVALVYVVYALLLKLRWKILHAMIGLLWGWLIFSLLSYLYHHDHTRAIDLLRTFFLRFTPLTLAASVLVTTTRPTDVVRLLRKLYIPGFVLLPLASVIRSLPQSRREFHQAVHQLKTDGTWTHWSSPLRKPHIIARRLISPQIHKWSTQLADEDQSPSRA